VNAKFSRRSASGRGSAARNLLEGSSDKFNFRGLFVLREKGLSRPLPCSMGWSAEAADNSRCTQDGIAERWCERWLFDGTNVNIVNAGRGLLYMPERKKDTQHRLLVSEGFDTLRFNC
jgi:hypothetical protein